MSRIFIDNSTRIGQFDHPKEMALASSNDDSYDPALLTIALSVTLGILIWDYFVLLSIDFQLYKLSSRTLWTTPTVFSFICLRYAAFIAILPALFLTSVPNRHCQVWVAASQLGEVMVAISSGIIMAYRLSATWSSNKAVNFIVGVMYLFTISSWVAVASHAHADTPTALHSICEMIHQVKWAPFSYATSFAFDLLILSLTIVKLPGRFASSSVCQIYRDSILYIVFITVSDLTALTIQTIPGDDFESIKPMVHPFWVLISTTMGSRLFFNLKLFKQQEEELPATSCSWTYNLETDGPRTSSLLSRFPLPPKSGIKPLVLGRAHTKHSQHERIPSDDPSISHHIHDSSVPDTRQFQLPRSFSSPTIPQQTQQGHMRSATDPDGSPLPGSSKPLPPRQSPRDRNSEGDGFVSLQRARSFEKYSARTLPPIPNSAPTSSAVPLSTPRLTKLYSKPPRLMLPMLKDAHDQHLHGDEHDSLLTDGDGHS